MKESSHIPRTFRRITVGVAALAFATLLVATTVGCSDDKATPAAGVTMYLGTYTKGWACDPMVTNDCTSEGIYKASFDPATGTISTPVSVAKTVNPSYLAISPNGKYLYAVNEVDDFVVGEKTGAVSAYSIAADGSLTLLNQVSSKGADPCHISVTRAGTVVMVANYSGGSVTTFAVGADGKLAEGNNVMHVGMGPHMNQTSPHAHFIVEGKNGLIYVADLGADKIFVYKLDAATAKLTPNTSPSVMLTPGSGPRHIAFHPSKDFVYSNDELSSSVTVFQHDPAMGKLTEIQTISSNPAGVTMSDTAEVQITPDGKYLYVSNRGPNTIGTFSIGADGKLTPINYPSTEGNWPRDFKLDPSGKYVLVGHQKSNDIFVFKVDPATGMLTKSGSKTVMSKPVNFVFMP
jgi:6-phosphogluconolactonase